MQQLWRNFISQPQGKSFAFLSYLSMNAVLFHRLADARVATEALSRMIGLKRSTSLTSAPSAPSVISATVDHLDRDVDADDDEDAAATAAFNYEDDAHDDGDVPALYDDFHDDRDASATTDSDVLWGKDHPDMRIVSPTMRVIWTTQEVDYISQWIQSNPHLPVRSLCDEVHNCSIARNIFHANHVAVDKLSYMFKKLR